MACRKGGTEMMNGIKEYPAPWTLHGKGYIFLYRFKKDFVERSGNIPEYLKDSFIGGFGSVMLVDYESSEAGPYGNFFSSPENSASTARSWIRSAKSMCLPWKVL